MCGQNNRQSQQEPVRHRTLIAQVIHIKVTPARRALHGLHCRSVTFRCVNCLKIDRFLAPVMVQLSGRGRKRLQQTPEYS